MVTAAALVHGDADKLLQFNAAEHPVALQLGGSDPAKLGEVSRIGADYGYDEINLNIGCPSDRVQSGRFGACLMTEPDLVATWAMCRSMRPTILFYLPSLRVLGSPPRSIMRSASIAHSDAWVFSRKVFAAYFPFRRTCARQVPSLVRIMLAMI